MFVTTRLITVKVASRVNVDTEAQYLLQINNLTIHFIYFIWQCIAIMKSIRFEPISRRCISLSQQGVMHQEELNHESLS